MLTSWDRKANKLVVVATGNGSFTEFKSKSDPGQCLFGVYKVRGRDELEAVTSAREYLISVNFIGESISPLVRNCIFSSKSERDDLFQGCVLEYQLASNPDTTEAEIARDLLRVNGAHKPTHYVFGDSRIAVADL